MRSMIWYREQWGGRVSVRFMVWYGVQLEGRGSQEVCGLVEDSGVGGRRSVRSRVCYRGQ